MEKVHLKERRKEGKEGKEGGREGRANVTTASLCFVQRLPPSLLPSLPSYLSFRGVHVYVYVGRRQLEGKVDEGVGMVGEDGRVYTPQGALDGRGIHLGGREGGREGGSGG